MAPWRSVYKIHLLSETDVTFVLTTGEHNAGIVSEPGHPGRQFQTATRPATEKYLDPETWQAWLATRSTDRVGPPRMGAPERGYPPLAEAPGSHVRQV